MPDIAALIPYMPIDRRHAYIAGKQVNDPTVGATLFADVSGFTALTGKLLRELGPKRGAEEVLVYLNPVFDKLISCLHDYGGVVIGFAGDSITCWLEGDDGRRAIACALAMQALMDPFRNMETDTGISFSLYIKVAVAAGKARRFAVGDPEIQLIDVLAGETLWRMAAAEKMAEKGETAVEEAILQRLGDAITVHNWRVDDEGYRVGIIDAMDMPVEAHPWPELDTSALDEETVGAWLLPPVYDRIQASHGYLAESRPAVTLFMRFIGFDYDNDPEAGSKLNAYIRWAQRIITRHDGFLIQLTIGDKGSYIQASFGAPISRGNNAVRALAAALTLKNGSTNYKGIAHVQIGVNAGRMWTGAYGGQQRQTYGVLSDEVNMAARLMSHSQPNQIMVTKKIVEATQAHYHFNYLNTIMVKGRVNPLRVWEVVDRRQSADAEWRLHTEPVLGRQHILNQLNETLSLVANGQGRVVRLSGAAGSGKSHLAAHFSQDARSRGSRLALGSCQSINTTTPYYPWRQIFRTLLNLDEDDADTQVAQLTSFLEKRHPNWLLRLPLLGDLLALPIPDNPTTAAMDANMRQKSLFSLLVEMIQMWAMMQPLLLVIENAHWMDEASMALTKVLAEQVVVSDQILLLLINRFESKNAEPVLPELQDLDYYVGVRLDDMTDEEVTALVTYRLGNSPTPLLLGILQATARGNPFFVNELIDAMRQSEQLTLQHDGSWGLSATLLNLLSGANFAVQNDGVWQLRRDADLASIQLGIPDSIHGIVLSRLDGLPEAHRLTLKVSSVIGHYFDLYLVANVHPEKKEVVTIQHEVEDLAVEEILHAEIPEKQRYAFRHHTTQEVAYDTLLHTQRVQLHSKIAQTLADQHTNAVTQIAHHAFLGELWPLALDYNLQAGEQAQQLYANKQSIDFYKRALSSAEALPDKQTISQRKTIQLALGELFVSTGQYEEATGYLQSALSLAKAQSDREAEAQACRWFARSHELRGEYDQAMTWIEQGFDSVIELDSVEEAELCLFAGLISIRQGNYDRALELCERSLKVADKLDQLAVRARTYNLMGIVDLRQGNINQALERSQQSLHQYEELEHRYGQATSHNLIANGYFISGDWPKSDYHYRQSLTMFTQIGDIYNQILVNNNLGGIALHQGRLGAALGYYQGAVRLLEQIGGSLYVFGALRMNIGNTLIQSQMLDEAADQLQQAEDYFDKAQLRDLLPELLGLKAELALHQQRIVDAEVYGHESVELAQELEMPREKGRSMRILGQIAQARGEFDLAEERFQAGCDLLSDSGDDYERAKTQLFLAHLHAAQNQQEAALSALTICEPIFSRLEAKNDLQDAKMLRKKLANLSVP
jgi:class 3 adenylate cyclase/tetratricopeptide (TPR) repeat protein